MVPDIIISFGTIWVLTLILGLYVGIDLKEAIKYCWMASFALLLVYGAIVLVSVLFG